MNVLIAAADIVELAVHRVLRWELAPFIRAIAADVSDASATIHVFHDPPDTADWRSVFEQTIESEWDQVLQKRVFAVTPRLRFSFHGAEQFSVPTEPNMRIIYVRY